MNIQTQASILNKDQKRAFESKYESRNKSKKPLVVLPVLTPVQLLVLGRIGLGVVFRLTMGEPCGLLSDAQIPMKLHALYALQLVAIIYIPIIHI